MAKFVLIGSGLAGGLLAAYLGRRGYEVDLYERRADPREGNIVGGRSINLAISTRGIHALEQIGIAEEALQHAIPMRGRMIHDRSGELHFTPVRCRSEKCINSIGRAALNTTVIEAAQRYPNVRVHFNHKCTDVDIDSALAHLETAKRRRYRTGRRSDRRRWRVLRSAQIDAEHRSTIFNTTKVISLTATRN